MHKPSRDTAFRLIEAGYSSVPIVPGAKRPALAGWQRLCDAPLSPDAIERFARVTAWRVEGIRALIASA